MKNILGFFLIFVSFIILLYVLYLNSGANKTNQTFSKYTLLTSSWEKYKDEYINKDGRVIDYSQQGVTTSEGQSYALLRAVWMDDKNEFDLVWSFTKNSLKRPSDHLFGWRWGKKANGTYGFATPSDTNSAADADEDIALALIFAGHRWNDSAYSDAAKQILSDMWKKEVGKANGQNYILAGNWANINGKLYVDPSYFAPYEYRVFATVDTNDDWNSLITPGYQMLIDSSKLPLDKSKSVGLPPDWITIDEATGQIAPSTTGGQTTNYGYDAIRAPWRIAIDYQWNSEPMAHDYLQNSFTYLINEFKNHRMLASTYGHDGSVIQSNESPAMYATSIAFFKVTNPDLAKIVYQEKLLTLYSNDTNSFNTKLPYYEQNWVWFGVALYNNQLAKL